MIYIGDTMSFDKLRTYIMEDEFEIKILDNRVNILNYEFIDHLDQNKVIIRHKKGRTIIKGKNLVVSKLLKDEILIVGNIINLELENTNE